MKPAIVIGNTADHGGIVSTGDSTYLIDGKAAHFEGMTHFCPKCKVTVTALSSSPLVVINGCVIKVAPMALVALRKTIVLFKIQKKKIAFFSTLRIRKQVNY